ncbi:hypothetical protein FRC02_003661 [Tulasnella sp. 418]|nr:hypothetical protein FRC02_003661 [Tulasnella sp. 418]
MSLKAELEAWAAALKAYDEQDYEKALESFSRIADTSKILTNIGLIYATIGQHELAVDNFNAACSLDRYLAVAYFQCGVSNFVLRRFELAFQDFAEAAVHLRENDFIDYEQLGLKFKLWSAEVIFNKGLCKIYLGETVEGIRLLEEARQVKQTPEHDVIDDAIADRGQGYNVFSIPAGILYRPSENKLKNAKAKDYLGKAKLVAAADVKDAYTTFVGATRLQQGQLPSGAPLPAGSRPPGSRDGSPIRNAAEISRTGSLSRSRTVNVAPSRDRANTANDGRQETGSALRRGATVTIGGVSDPFRGRSGSAAADFSGGGGRNSGGSSGGSNSGAQPLPAGVVKGLTIRRPSGENGRFSPAKEVRRPSADDALGVGLSVARGPSPLREREEPRRNQDRAPQRPQRPSDKPTPSRSRTTDETSPRMGERGVTQIYDDYLDAYGGVGDGPPEVPPLNVGRVAAWANKTIAGASPNMPPSRTPSVRTGGNNAALRRQLSRRPTYGGGGRAPSKYADEDDDGGYYGDAMSGQYDDLVFDLIKIRVKLHYSDDVRGMALSPDLPFEEFVDKITMKFGKRYGQLSMKFKDEDGGKVSLKDEMDYEMAIETARESAQGRPEGKLEIWLTDVE